MNHLYNTGKLLTKEGETGKKTDDVVRLMLKRLEKELC